jgi:hypothetical protein
MRRDGRRKVENSYRPVSPDEFTSDFVRVRCGFGELWWMGVIYLNI